MKRWERAIAGAIVFLSAGSSTLAADLNEKAVQACITDAAKAFAVPALPVRILRRVEAGAVGTASRNRDGTYDLGPMQVNSSWLPKLARVGISEDQLRFNPCVNAYVGTWIYAQEYAAAHAEAAVAMAHYHSPNPAEQRRYLSLVLKVIDHLAPKLASAD